MFLWRISNHLELDGGGRLSFPGRWHGRGNRVVYCAGSPPGALVEVLVHLELADGFVPRKYQLHKVEVPEGVSTGRVAAAELPEGWEANTVLTRGIGDRWLMQGSSAVLEVPSAIVPETANWLLNPLHADAGSIGIAQHYGFGLDQRFLRFGPQ